MYEKAEFIGRGRVVRLESKRSHIRVGFGPLATTSSMELVCTLPGKAAGMYVLCNTLHPSGLAFKDAPHPDSQYIRCRHISIQYLFGSQHIGLPLLVQALLEEDASYSGFRTRVVPTLMSRYPGASPAAKPKAPRSFAYGKEL